MEKGDTTEGHFGLLGMRERAMIVGAQFSITSKPGQGTRVHVRFPLNPEDMPAETAQEAARRKRLPRKRVLHEGAPEKDALTAEVIAAGEEAARTAELEAAESPAPFSEEG